LEDLSIVEIHLIGYLLQQYKDFYKQDEIKNYKVTDFKTIFIEKLNLDYFSDLNKYICYSLFIEYEKYKKVYERDNILFSLIANEFREATKEMV
jgi:hypothetical protein